MSSATTQALRTSLRRAASCRRYASSSSASAPSSSSSSSSSSKLDIRPKAELPADKMRILVDLYHQSKTFITKENLSDAIDEAFIYAHAQRQTLHPETPFAALEMDVMHHRRSPKFAPPNNMRAISSSKDASHNKDWDWSHQRGPREAAVMSTLYGVTDGKGEPQYDALVDGYQAVKQEIEKEKSAKGGESE
ncbi:hypothetical protein K466DRAFT_537194 [Polyporus arcularius HHB13444]|uniref:Uncharacterized protein n=1 Tax=Polyporus arcularius HHB13444 TaxID=1314778 RepID=A0A5C3Q147_9APHY|nr:hypothetical protein K466DRAFT_537194 [Polyporus arcularius HHB13444]